MHLDKLDDKWMIAGQNRQQDQAGREKGLSGNLLLSVTLMEGSMLGTMYIYAGILETVKCTHIGSSKAKWTWTGTVQMKILPVNSRG